MTLNQLVLKCVSVLLLPFSFRIFNDALIFSRFFFSAVRELGKTSPQTFPHPLHGITSVFSWFQHLRPEQNEQVSYISQQNHDNKWFSADIRLCQHWPGRNRKSKRMCSFSVNSTFSLKDTWDQSPRGPLPLNFVTLPILFNADPDSGWLILGRTVGISLSSQEKLFLAWLLAHADLCMERMVACSNAREAGLSWEDLSVRWKSLFLSPFHYSSQISKAHFASCWFQGRGPEVLQQQAQLLARVQPRLAHLHGVEDWYTGAQELRSGTQSAFCKTGKYWEEQVFAPRSLQSK